MIHCGPHGTKSTIIFVYIHKGDKNWHSSETETSSPTGYSAVELTSIGKPQAPIDHVSIHGL